MRPSTAPLKTASGGTRLTVKRCCDRCGREVGDATEEELEAAVGGLPLPDVTDECGCVLAGVAVLTVADHQDDTDIPLELGNTTTFQCLCGETYTATDEVSWADALQAHQVEFVRQAIREARA